jgi:prepilin-type N-terminal cleavage/methylation domain-containing protein
MTCLPQRARRGDAGFTLLELVVAMGLLSGFLLMLVRLLTTGADLFDEGERGQELLDRSASAVRVAQRALTDTCGPRLIGRPDGRTDARLLVHSIPTGVGEGAARVQLLRSTENLDPALEDSILRTAFEAEAAAEGLRDDEAERAVRDRLAAWPRSGRGEVQLFPWPVGEDGVFFELRRRDLPTDPMLYPVDELPVLDIRDPEDLDVDFEKLVLGSRSIARGLLHFELRFWSQRTRTWQLVGTEGPERSWDSARGGLMLGETEGSDLFGLDLGPSSLADPRDDVWPRWVRVVVTVDAGPQSPPASFLTQAITDADTSVSVTRPEDIPDPSDQPWLKIGAEWVRFQGVVGRTLTGVRRGQRGTKAIAHPVGTPVRAGREAVLDVQIPHGRDGDE